MDSAVPVQNSQDADNEAGDNQVAGPSRRQNVNEPEEAAAQALGNRVILCNIFQYLSQFELIPVAGVNRLWMNEVKATVRNRYPNMPMSMLMNVIYNVTLKERYSPQELWDGCHELSDVTSTNILEFERQGGVIDRKNLIANMQDRNTRSETIVFVRRLVELSSKARPLLGIYVKLDGLHGDSCPPASALEKLRSKCPSDPQPTFLTVHFGRRWCQHKDCPEFGLLNQLLGASDCYIEHLSLIVSSDRQRFLQFVHYNFTFERLVTLEFRDRGFYTTSTAYTNFIKEIVSRAPNLQTLYTRGRVDLSVNLLDGLPEESQAMHVTDYPYSPSLDEIPEHAVDSLRMKRMELLGISADFNLERFHRITVKLLQACRSILSHMDIDIPFLLPLMTYGISLEKVAQLFIRMGTTCFNGSVHVNAWERMKSFNFKRVFPKLRKVVIEGDWRNRERTRSVLYAFSPVVGPGQENDAPNDRTNEIQHLNLKWDTVLPRLTVQALAQMFPSIRGLSIRAKGTIPFNVIWRSWPRLERLNITIVETEGNNPFINYDSVFCGIFPEEVAELREMDDGYLHAVNIVPVMPSWRSLKGSRPSLMLSLQPTSIPPIDDDRTDYLFSKVTPLIAFKNTEVTLKTNHFYIKEELISHLEPYVHDVLFLDY